MPVEWWGNLSIPVGREERLRIGPLVLVIQRLPNEWQVVRYDTPAQPGTEARAGVPTDQKELPPGAEIARFATSRSGGEMHVVPILPDRTVLTRPELPITLLPRTLVTLYVGSPVWVRLLQDQGDLVGELPISPPKKAWLGPSTLSGELCYVTRTVGRLSLSESTLQPHRVVTPIEIHNDSAEPFVCEQVALPVRQLSVFGSSSGRLFTEAIRLVRSESDEFARLEVSSGPPREAGDAKLLSSPREIESASVFRAFGRLFA